MVIPVSVLVPTFNGEAYVGWPDALQSIWRQSALPAELIVIDDCSTDHTAARIQQLLKSSPVPARLIRLNINSEDRRIPSVWE